MDVLKVKDYKMIVVIEQDDPYDGTKFNELVNEYIKKGYKLFGRSIIFPDNPVIVFSQVMVLLDDESEVDNG